MEIVHKHKRRDGVQDPIEMKIYVLVKKIYDRYCFLNQ